MLEIYLNLLTNDSKVWYIDGKSLDIEWAKNVYDDAKDVQIDWALETLGIKDE